MQHLKAVDLSWCSGSNSAGNVSTFNRCTESSGRAYGARHLPVELRAQVEEAQRWRWHAHHQLHHRTTRFGIEMWVSSRPFQPKPVTLVVISFQLSVNFKSSVEWVMFAYCSRMEPGRRNYGRFVFQVRAAGQQERVQIPCDCRQ